MDLLNLLIIVPAVATAIMFVVPGSWRTTIRTIPVLAGAICLALAGKVFWDFVDNAAAARQVYEVDALAGRREWVPNLGIWWAVAADGMSAAMIFLTSIVMFTGALVSLRSEASHTGIGDRPKEFFLLFLGLVTGVFGVFLFRDLFLFYFSYELAVVPMYLLIGVWGSTQATANKEYAAMKLTLYLTAGALLALVGILALYFRAWDVNGKPSFLMLDLFAAADKDAFGRDFQIATYPFLFLGFAAIIPMWPMHTWSPIGHAAAPAAGSMMHAGVLMKLGAYAVIRIAFSLCPEGAAHWMPWVATIAMMNIVYGGLVAMAQKDLKFVIGFSSSSHMGYTLLGLASMEIVGVSGAVFLMFAHGVMTALAFALIGFFYDQSHNRWIPDLGGLAHQLPFVGTCFVFMAMASAGVPGFANFASELMVMVAAWKAGFVWQAVVSVFGVVIGAVYLLRCVRDTFFGPRNPRWDGLHDAHGLQRVPFLFLLAVLLFFGFYPKPMVDVITAGVTPIVEKIRATDEYKARYPDSIDLARGK